MIVRCIRQSVDKHNSRADSNVYGHILQKGQTGNGGIIMTHRPRRYQKPQKSVFRTISSYNRISILYNDSSMLINT